MPSKSLAWVFDPHSGGSKPIASVKLATEQRLQQHFSALGYAQKARRGVRFRGALCCSDASREPEPALVQRWRSEPDLDVQASIERYSQCQTHLGRLRHFAKDRWSCAFYTCSNERYEPTTFASFGDGWFGTPEQALEIGCMYLAD